MGAFLSLGNSSQEEQGSAPPALGFSPLSGMHLAVPGGLIQSKSKGKKDHHVSTLKFKVDLSISRQEWRLGGKGFVSDSRQAL